MTCFNFINMFNVIILEDEVINRRLLSQLVTEYIDDVVVVAECANVQDAYDEIKKHDHVIILLDIELDAFENGFDLIKLLENRNDSIIVVSAFIEYAIKAFRLDVVDFVTKPIRISELTGAFDRVKKKSILHSNREILTDNHDKLIGVQLFNKTTFVNKEDIVLIKSDLSGTLVFMNSKMTINSIERIGQIEARLDKFSFSRIDKSNIVHLSYVSNYYVNDGQLILEIQKGETKLVVSRRKKTATLKQLELFFKS